MTSRGRIVRSACCLLSVLIAGETAAHIDRVFACFVNIEPFEIRVEFVVSTDSMGLSDEVLAGGLDETEQAQVMPVLRERMRDAFSLRADDRPVDLQLDEVAFVLIHPDKGAIPDRRKVIPEDGSRVSAIFVAERAELPGIVELAVHLYEDERYRPPTRVPVRFEVITSPDDRASQQFYLNSGFPVRAWELPEEMRFKASIEDAPVLHRPSYAPLFVSGGLVLAGLLVWIAPVPAVPKNARRWVSTGVLASGLVTAGIAWAQGFTEPIEETRGRQTIESLLANVYFAFTFRNESKVFDTLATSVDGPLLESLYLDIRRGLSDAEDGGPSVRVIDVQVQDCTFIESTTDRLRARVRWLSAGTVSHWGHAHHRRNGYLAEVVAEPIDGHWRLTSVQILEEERVE